jgi:hypothetical protein
VNPKHDKLYVAGSSALSTSFCLLALHKYQTALATSSRPKKQNSDNSYQQIIKLAQARIDTLVSPLKEVGQENLELILGIDRDQQIILLPFFFCQVIKQQVPSHFVQNLCAANLFGWMAYTLYDDFLDEEGQLSHLNFANFCLRSLTELYFQASQQHKQIFTLFTQVLNQLDWANTWEVTHCRVTIYKQSLNLEKISLPEFGNFEVIAYKSLGHALGPLSIFLATGHSERRSEFKNLYQFFIHFIIAKQLNDDAHDVFEDLSRGHLTPVNTQLLKDWQLVQDAQILQLGDLELRRIFWTQTIKTTSQIILKHCQTARQFLAKVSEEINLAFGTRLLAPIEKAAHQAISQQSQTQEFLDSYFKEAK